MVFENDSGDEPAKNSATQFLDTETACQGDASSDELSDSSGSLKDFIDDGALFEEDEGESHSDQPFQEKTENTRMLTKLIESMKIETFESHGFSFYYKRQSETPADYLIRTLLA